MKRHLWPTVGVPVCVVGVIVSIAQGNHGAVPAWIVSTVFAAVTAYALEQAEQWHRRAEQWRRAARVWTDIARSWWQRTEDAIAETDQAVRDGEIAVQVALARVAAREGDGA